MTRQKLHLALWLLAALLAGLSRSVVADPLPAAEGDEPAEVSEDEAAEDAAEDEPAEEGAAEEGAAEEGAAEESDAGEAAAAKESGGEEDGAAEDSLDQLTDADFGVEPPDTPAPVVKEPEDPPAVQMAAGLVGTRRTLSFDPADGQEESKPPTYQSSWAPKLRAALELYPLAWFNPARTVSGVGVLASYERTLEQVMDSPEAVEQRLYLGVSYRIRPGAGPERPTFTATAGFMRHKVDVQDASIDVPDVIYAAGGLGLDVRIPLGTPRLALLGDARYLMVGSAGEISMPSSYGDGRVAGLELGAGVEARGFGDMFVRIAGRYTSYAFELEGTGVLSSGLVGAKDRYLNLTASVGLLLE